MSSPTPWASRVEPGWGPWRISDPTVEAVEAVEIVEPSILAQYAQFGTVPSSARLLPRMIRNQSLNITPIEEKTGTSLWCGGPIRGPKRTLLGGEVSEAQG